MAHDEDPTALAWVIIDANRYMVLGTGDAAGRPWVSPVYYAPVGYLEFLWLSSPDDVRDPSRLRLYLATAHDHYVLETGVDRRIPVSP